MGILGKNKLYLDLWLRPRQPNDSYRIEQIFSAAYIEELNRIGAADVCMATLVPRSDVSVTVAEYAGEVLGFIEHHTDAICGLYVDPVHHRRGVGRSLLRHSLENTATAINAEVFAGNEAALALFFQEGFEVVRRTETTLRGSKKYAPSYLLESRRNAE